jgi:DNA-binding transcriptional regulator YiaG
MGFGMRTKTVITLIRKLKRQCGSYEKAGQELGVTARYVRHLEKGEKAPSEHLRKLIQMVIVKKAIHKNKD